MDLWLAQALLLLSIFSPVLIRLAVELSIPATLIPLLGVYGAMRMREFYNGTAWDQFWEAMIGLEIVLFTFNVIYAIMRWGVKTFKRGLRAPRGLEGWEE